MITFEKTNLQKLDVFSIKNNLNNNIMNANEKMR